jgi:hypothetical protein
MNEIHRDPGGRGGGIFDEIRRQMEEMLGGQVKPPRASALPGGPTVRRGTPGPGTNRELAITAAAAYWLIPIAGAKRKRKLRRAAARAAAEQAAPPTDTTQA